MKSKLWSFACCVAALATTPSRAFPLVEQPSIKLPGKAADFDFMAVDAARGRLLAAHKGSGSLTIVDLTTEALVKEVKVGAAQGVAVNEQDDTYAVGTEDEQKVLIIDGKTTAVTAAVAVGGPVDAVAIDQKRGFIYAAKDAGPTLWVVDPKAKAVIATIALPGEPESLIYDKVTDRIYQSIKNKNAVVVINPATYVVAATWSRLPATSSHGLALDAERGKLYVAGRHGGIFTRQGPPSAIYWPC